MRAPEHALVSYTGATITPEAVVFDANRETIDRGRIDDRNAALGQTKATPTRRDLEDAIEAALAGKRVAEPVTTAVGCFIGDLK